MKKKTDLHVHEVPGIAGHSSRELTDRCPDLRNVFPKTPCLNGGCPFAIRQPEYMNCTFVAAEAGDHTLEAIGEMMGMTREGVRLIERKALIKYHHRMQLDGTPIRKPNVAARAHLDSSDDKGAECDDESDDVPALYGGNVAQRGR